MAEDTSQDKGAVRDAATVIVLRDRYSSPSILMGQRGAKAVFMPNKFVFPGGAVDKEDAEVPLHETLSAVCRSRIAEDASEGLDNALAAAAIRELWEETGLKLGVHGVWTTKAPLNWEGFAQSKHIPDASSLQFFFRAITPPGRPRRFDARFFLLDAEHIAGDIDDFSSASDELSHLQWVPLERARSFDMPFITQVVLSELRARVHNPAPPESVPFFKNNDEESLFLRLYGHRPVS